jgi:hypothetical protein
MNIKEYSDKMIELCAKQLDLKTSHKDLMDDLNEQERKEVEGVRKRYREQRANLSKRYRNEQLQLEREKQRLHMLKELGEITAE